MNTDVLYGTLLSAVIGTLSATIAGYVLSRLMMKKAQNMISDIKNDVFDDFTELLNTEQGKVLFYNIGVLIASGAKSGFGLQKTKGGKGGLMDLLLQALPQFLNMNGGGGALGSVLGNPQQQQQQQSSENAFQM